MQYYTIGGELYHHGVLHQQWGVRNGPPYPLSPDKSTGKRLKDKPGKGAKSLVSNIKAKSRYKKALKRRNAALEKARQTKAKNIEERRTAEQREADKQKALKSGTASDVLKFKGEYTSQQLNDVVNRLQKEGQLEQMSAADKKTVADKIDRIINNIDRARNWTEKGISAYNTAVKIANTFSDADLPIIGEKKQNQNQSQKKKKKK